MNEHTKHDMRNGSRFFFRENCSLRACVRVFVSVDITSVVATVEICQRVEKSRMCIQNVLPPPPFLRLHLFHPAFNVCSTFWTLWINSFSIKVGLRCHRKFLQRLICRGVYGKEQWACRICSQVFGDCTHTLPTLTKHERWTWPFSLCIIEFHFIARQS